MQPHSPPARNAYRPCRASDRLVFAGYLFAGTVALALATLAFGEGDLWLGLRSLSAFLSAGLLRTYLLQAGQFHACADGLEPTENGRPLLRPTHLPPAA